MNPAGIHAPDGRPAQQVQATQPDVRLLGARAPTARDRRAPASMREWMDALGMTPTQWLQQPPALKLTRIAQGLATAGMANEPDYVWGILRQLDQDTLAARNGVATPVVPPSGVIFPGHGEFVACATPLLPAGDGPTYTYRAASSFTSTAPYAAWWTYTHDGVVHYCAASPRFVLGRVQAALRLPTMARWTAATVTALRTRAGDYARARPGQGWEALLPRLSLTTRGSVTTLSPDLLRLALWLAFYEPVGLRLDALGFPAGTAPPQLDVDAPSTGGELLCWIPGTQNDAELLSPAQALEAAQQSAAGLRLRPGEDVPHRPVVTVPPRVGWSMGQLAAAAVGITGVVLLGRWLLGGTADQTVNTVSTREGSL